MGRPIKKRFFANLNSPYQNQATGGLTGAGGEGVASVVITTTGTNYTTLPGVTFAAPGTQGGTTAIGTATSLKAVSATVAPGGAGTGYNVGQTLTVSGGTSTAPATFSVVRVSVESSTVVNSGTNFLTGDTVTISGSGWIVPHTATVTANVLGNIVSLTPVTAGIYSGVTALVNPISVTATSGTGTTATLNLTLGVATVSSTPVQAGVYTVVPANSATTTVSPSGGTGTKLNVVYGVNAVSVTTTGSGYVSAPTVTFSAGNAAATAVLQDLKSSGLTVSAFLTTGTTAVVSDIMKQESTSRYLVRNAEGKGQCKLVATATNALVAGEMNLIATDHLGGTYYVTKLTARRARVVQATGSFYASNVTVGWTLNTPVVGTVKIANG